jgi:putative addiction module component (TIGR02574 family)
MAVTNLALVEEALALSPAERAELARVLIHSLQDDPRTDDEIKTELSRRLNALISGSDPGLSFQEVFGTPS